MKKNKRGFTLAELLIVVAIIGVLVAISIPIFNNQLKKARMATNQANARAAYAAAVAEYISLGEPQPADAWYFTYEVSKGTVVMYQDRHIPSGVGFGAMLKVDGKTPGIESWPGYPADTIFIESFYRQTMKRWTFQFNRDGSIKTIYYSQSAK